MSTTRQFNVILNKNNAAFRMHFRLSAGLRSLTDLVIAMHLPVGLSLAAIYGMVERTLGQRPDERYVLFLILAGAGGYTALRLYHLQVQRDCLRRLYRKYFLYFLIYLGLLGMAALFAGLPYLRRYPHRWIWPVILFVFYNLKSGIKWLSWREIGWLKVLIVAFVWAWLTVVLPAGSLDTARRMLFWAVWLWVLLLIIPFDMRDVLWDDQSLRTLPRLFKEKTPWAAAVLSLAAIFLTVFMPASLLCRLSWWAGISATFGAILLSRRQRGFYFTALGVESIPFWTALLMYLLCGTGM